MVLSTATKNPTQRKAQVIIYFSIPWHPPPLRLPRSASQRHFQRWRTDSESTPQGAEREVPYRCDPCLQWHSDRVSDESPIHSSCNFHCFLFLPQLSPLLLLLSFLKCRMRSGFGHHLLPSASSLLSRVGNTLLKTLQRPGVRVCEVGERVCVQCVLQGEGGEEGGGGGRWGVGGHLEMLSCLFTRLKVCLKMTRRFSFCRKSSVFMLCNTSRKPWWAYRGVATNPDVPVPHALPLGGDFFLFSNQFSEVNAALCESYNIQKTHKQKRIYCLSKFVFLS